MPRPPPPTIPVPTSNSNWKSTPGNGDARLTPPPLGPQPSPDLIDTQVLLEALDGIACRVFSVGLTLAAARSLASGPETARLDQALDELDELVGELRHAALAAHLPDIKQGRHH